MKAKDKKRFSAEVAKACAIQKRIIELNHELVAARDALDAIQPGTLASAVLLSQAGLLKIAADGFTAGKLSNLEVAQIVHKVGQVRNECRRSTANRN